MRQSAGAGEECCGSDAELAEDAPVMESDGLDADPPARLRLKRHSTPLVRPVRPGNAGGLCSCGCANCGEFPVADLHVGPVAQREEALPGLYGDVLGLAEHRELGPPEDG